MTTASKSVFYDGQSSVPKNIQLWFDSNTGQFTFEIENKSVDNEELNRILNSRVLYLVNE